MDVERAQSDVRGEGLERRWFVTVFEPPTQLGDDRGSARVGGQYTPVVDTE